MGNRGLRRLSGATFALLLQFSVLSSLLHPCCLTHDRPSPDGRAAHAEAPVAAMAHGDTAAQHGATRASHGTEGEQGCCGGLCQCPCLDASADPNGVAVALMDLPPHLDRSPDGYRSIPRPTPTTFQPFATGPPATS